MGETGSRAGGGRRSWGGSGVPFNVRGQDGRQPRNRRGRDPWCRAAQERCAGADGVTGSCRSGAPSGRAGATGAPGSAALTVSPRQADRGRRAAASADPGRFLRHSKDGGRCPSRPRVSGLPRFAWHSGCRTLRAAAAVLIAVGAITVQTPQKVVEAARGKNATLPCTYQTTATDMTGSTIQWKKMPDEIIAIEYLGGGTYSDDAYKDRVSFTGNFKANDASAFITKLRMEDNGTYQCEVVAPQDRTGTRFAKMDLVVLVAPSKPVCGIAGTAEYGQVIQLTCNSEEGSPIPAYTWKSFSPQNVERQLPPTAVIDNGGLTLKNISMDTSGFFICTSTNKIGSDFCNITLAVMPPSMNIALYAGAIGGSVAAIIVIAIIVYCCCCRDKEDKEDYEMADREEEEEEEEEDRQPQQKKKIPQQEQQYYQEDEGEEDDIEDNPPQKPPMPPSNKPRLVLNNIDA